MVSLWRNKNNPSLICGLLLLATTLCFTNLHSLADKMGFTATITGGILIIVVGLTDRRFLFLLNLILGLFFASVGTFGMYDLFMNPSGNRLLDAISAVLIFISGYGTTTIAIFKLLRKKKRPYFEFDFENQLNNTDKT